MRFKSFIIFATLFAFGLGIFVGNSWSTDGALFNKLEVESPPELVGKYGKGQSSEVHFDQFWDVWNTIKEKYVKEPVDDAALFYGAIEGLVASLEDPYSVYFPPKKAEEFAKDLAGEFDGIGAEIGIRENQLSVIAPLQNSPAEKADLRTGDKLYAIDGTDTFGLTVEEAIAKIRGKKGTTVVLTISHSDENIVQDIPIVRATINVPTVIFETKENNVGYLRISYFNDNTWSEFDDTVKIILKKNINRLVLDLRSNPGGYLHTSVDVASEWVADGLIVQEAFRGGATKTYETGGKHRLAPIKTVVLVDQGTASGAEIVAGALQDHKVATLIGEKTYGKGSVQDYSELPDGSALKLTVAEWLTPLGRKINGEGVQPDITMTEMFVEKNPGVATGTPKEYSDKGLEKAMELLK